MDSYTDMLKLQDDFKGIYIRSPWATIEEVKKVEQENPDYIVWGGYGCIYMYPKFN